VQVPGRYLPDLYMTGVEKRTYSLRWYKNGKEISEEEFTGETFNNGR
jgi:hypothetical protein